MAWLLHLHMTKSTIILYSILKISSHLISQQNLPKFQNSFNNLYYNVFFLQIEYSCLLKFAPLIINLAPSKLKFYKFMLRQFININKTIKCFIWYLELQLSYSGDYRVALMATRENSCFQHLNFTIFFIDQVLQFVKVFPQIINLALHVRFQIMCQVHSRFVYLLCFSHCTILPSHPLPLSPSSFSPFLFVSFIHSHVNCFDLYSICNLRRVVVQNGHSGHRTHGFESWIQHLPAR